MSNFSNAVRAFKVMFSDYVEDICRGLSVPDKKLVADLLFGMLKGGDVLVSDIARALNEGNTLDSTEVRLTSAMKRFDYAGLDDAIQKRVFGIFSDPYSLAVDESDIGKEQAKSMEGLCTVKDGSKSGEVFHQGYHMTGLVAIGGRKRNPMILCYDIWSSGSEGFVSSNDQTERILRKAFLNAGEGKGEISLDRGYDDAKTFDFIARYGFGFCIRVRSHRKYIVNGKRMGTDDMSRSRKGKYLQRFIDSEGKEAMAKCSGFMVTHRDIDGRLMLAMERFSQTDVRFYITSMADTSRESVMHAIRLYRKRWRVEELFRFAKQCFGLERFMVRSMNAMNVIARTVTMAVNFLTEIAMSGSLLHDTCRRLYPKFKSQAKREASFETKDRFVLEIYQIKEGLQLLLTHTERRPEVKHRDRKKGAVQMTIDECISQESVEKH